eukprot:7391879-Prymnesium_polylepis.5
MDQVSQRLTTLFLKSLSLSAPRRDAACARTRAARRRSAKSQRSRGLRPATRPGLSRRSCVVRRAHTELLGVGDVGTCRRRHKRVEVGAERAHRRVRVGDGWRGAAQVAVDRRRRVEPLRLEARRRIGGRPGCRQLHAPHHCRGGGTHRRHLGRRRALEPLGVFVVVDTRVDTQRVVRAPPQHGLDGAVRGAGGEQRAREVHAEAVD